MKILKLINNERKSSGINPIKACSEYDNGGCSWAFDNCITYDVSNCTGTATDTCNRDYANCHGLGGRDVCDTDTCYKSDYQGD